MPPQSRHRRNTDADTDVLPVYGRQPAWELADTVVFPPVSGDLTVDAPEAERSGSSLGRATGSMAIAGLVSKITGLARNLVIAWVLGLSVAADAYNAANTLPNQVYALLVGGVLTSVLVPVLVRARTEDPDGGVAYTQRLITMTTVFSLLVTVLAVACAPLLTALVVDDSTGRADPALTTAFAYLLLPQILCYGLTALLTAVLNARHVFGITVWAPVANNVVLLVTFGIYPLLPGPVTLDPARLDTAQVLELGIGSTLGVAVQAVILVPAVLRSGLRLRWRWGLDHRFAEFGRLAAWALGYALLAQVGVVVVTNVATANGGLTIYNTVWLLVQLPYGVLGFALITAILPRMSRAAAARRFEDVKNDLSLATRLCSATMLPISALLTVLGPSLGQALFSFGHSAGDAGRLGVALGASAFGALPYCITSIQMQVFYAMKDARTPTLIMSIMMAVKVSLSYLAPHVLSPSHTVYGLVFANSFAFVSGWVVGEVWLHARLGRLGTRRVGLTIGKSLVAAVAAGVVALGVREVSPGGTAGAWLTMIVGGGAGIVAALSALNLLHTPELAAIRRRIG
ncbi:MAG TPA: murein biosynthesis integral membrane protein MurJ [Pseudonocardiaceae bacterium]|nr:murein biosynthesis integral membrane protein MurJ [Pseudonocardiaceae bacterium]